ncbi:Retrovirus-related Pol polyprotein from transposon TNT 1-94 [Apostasia shenzhenica]|uniref:Retrovirus-related Pol polyprotein from transposon TNT 1-94 n=1 Tax=Apostasia shenzhenica TaxID=1088818 RepID=A0A2I0B7F5_9ASPA|nr:Retrovirus-related Pol polyprotein from transposon TNT 1-94 [Apostasia shenzhenica]
MSKHNYIILNNNTYNKCKICVQTKIIKKPFSKIQRSTSLLELIHTDICELNGKLTRGGKRYFITFIDDCSKYVFVYLLRTKYEAFDKFKEYKTMVENQKEKKIKLLQSDRGGEYFSYSFNEFCEEHGIIHQMSASYTPQQNGVAERKNQTLVEMVNVMLMNAKLSFNFWGEALYMAYHINNRTPSMKTYVSPYKVWNGRKPNIGYFKVWGCIAFYKILDHLKLKLGPRGIRSVFVRYAKNSKAYR